MRFITKDVNNAVSQAADRVEETLLDGEQKRGGGGIENEKWKGEGGREGEAVPVNEDRLHGCMEQPQQPQMITGPRTPSPPPPSHTTHTHAKLA